MKGNIMVKITFLLIFVGSVALAQEKPEKATPAKAQKQQQNQQKPEEASHGTEIRELSQSTENGKEKGKIISSAARKGSLRVTSNQKGSGADKDNAVEGKGKVSSGVIKTIGRPSGVGNPGGVAPTLPSVVPPAVPVPPVIRPNAPPGTKPVIPPVTPPSGLPIGIP